MLASQFHLGIPSFALHSIIPVITSTLNGHCFVVLMSLHHASKNPGCIPEPHEFRIYKTIFSPPVNPEHDPLLHPSQTAPSPTNSEQLLSRHEGPKLGWFLDKVFPQ